MAQNIQPSTEIVDGIFLRIEGGGRGFLSKGIDNNFGLWYHIIVSMRRFIWRSVLTERSEKGSAQSYYGELHDRG